MSSVWGVKYDGRPGVGVRAEGGARQHDGRPVYHVERPSTVINPLTASHDFFWKLFKILLKSR